jgi:hypothetical protein
VIGKQNLTADSRWCDWIGERAAQAAGKFRIFENLNRQLRLVWNVERLQRLKAESSEERMTAGVK